MLLSICKSCGTEIDSETKSCPLCGAPQPGNEDSSSDMEGQEGPYFTVRKAFWSLYPDRSNVFYRATLGLAVGYTGFVLLSLSTNNVAFFTFGIVLATLSILSLYLDLLGLEVHLYDTRPVLWVIGAVLMYFLVVPLYVYKRQRVRDLRTTE